MNTKTFKLVAGSLFLVVAILHMARVLGGWDMNVEGWTVPMLLSWVAFLVTGYLAYIALKK